MLSTITSTAPTATVRIKSLDSRVAPDEQKDLELESEELANNEEEEHSASESEAEHVIHSGLSSRALAIKQYLREKTQAKAILLKEDGSSEEISYDGSSSGTRSLVGGRPSIIGEIEELQVVVIQSLDQSRRSAVNKHTLPVPLCHNQGGGDYVVYRVDSVGSAGDITLEEYRKYVDDHKTLTATSVKNYSVENEQIGSNSPFDSSSKISMESLRGALETAIVGECSSAEIDKMSISSTVRRRVQKLVDEAVATLSASPMEDPDYKPEDEGMQFDGELVIYGSGYDVVDDLRPLSVQLGDAVEHIRLIGKLDGEGFAERILSTMYEVNGSWPTLDEMANLYDRIRTDFGNEAASELEDEEESEAEIESESESEIESEFEVEVEIEESEWSSVLDIIRSVGRKDGSILASNLCSILYGEYGSEPSLERLTDLWYGIQEELAAEAAEEEEGGDSSDDDEDADYDPDNLDDHFLAELDEAESRRHSIRHFEAESESEDGSEGDDEYEAALDHIRSIGRKDGRFLAENVCDLFHDENGREPSLEELHAVWQSIEDGLAAEAEEESDDEETAYDPQNAADQRLAHLDAAADREHEIEHFEQILLNTPTVSSKRGGGVSFNVYFDERDLSEEAENSNLLKTVDGFKMMNRREPTKLELHRMKLFLAVPNELLDGEEEISITATITMLRSPIVASERGGAASWTVYFDEGRGSLDGANKAFQRVHHREPTPFELDQIRSFLAMPKELTHSELRPTFKPKQRESTKPRTPSKVMVSPISTKKTAKRFNVYLEDSKLSQKESERTAVQWFARFHQRQPSEEELATIQGFVQKDAHLTEQEFLVPVHSLNFDDDDEEEQANGQHAVEVDDQQIVDID